MNRRNFRFRPAVDLLDRRTLLSDLPGSGGPIVVLDPLTGLGTPSLPGQGGPIIILDPIIDLQGPEWGQGGAGGYWGPDPVPATPN